MTATLQRNHVVEWSVASRAVPGENVSGDLQVIAPSRDGVLVAVVDGLGHGDEATAAARLAAQTIEAHANDPMLTLVRHCHQALRTTRGAVMTIVSLNGQDDTMTAIGIGNVETVLFRADPAARPRRESVLLRGGVVGYQLPALQASVSPLTVGDVVVFATDGVREDFSDLITPAEALPQMVEKIIAQKFRGNDDGLVLACKYLGKT